MLRIFLAGIIAALALCPSLGMPQAGEVYLVLGSDTAIWDGMNVARYHCTYDLSLFTDPHRNAHAVMEPAFRARFVDSYGQPLKMTWWMMAGNIFRYATNNNVPVPNTMTLHLMKKYFGEQIAQNGDELSLHYHTFAWTDYDHDGVFWWNQALSFSESADDFNFTLAQFLLEENVFPVSFRSGWHYMDNDWQHQLDRLLPYSLHNDYPNIRIDTSEPLDNTFDWSQAPSAFVPYRPAPENYQISGNGRGWNVRSAHFNRTRQRDLLDSIFAQADKGIDQVACLWGHLPETDFLTNIAILDSLAHKMTRRYPAVKFRYCTAVEAMQRWLRSTDQAAPEIIFREERNGDALSFYITTNEPIFQPTPWVALKDVYERYTIANCEVIGANQWRATTSIPAGQLAKAGVAVCDTVGNQATGIIRFLPDDVYVDNRDAGYLEIGGNWSASDRAAWGVDSRIATLAANDSAKTQWRTWLDHTGNYNVFVQVPEVAAPAGNILFRVVNQQRTLAAVRFDAPLPARTWVYIGTFMLIAPGESAVEMIASGNGQTGKTVAADVVKFSALVREREMHLDPEFVDLGEVSLEDTASFAITVSNHGIGDLTILGLSSAHQSLFAMTPLPIVIPRMGSLSVTMQFYPRSIGASLDTLFIRSDDFIRPFVAIPVVAEVLPYFDIIDNEENARYSEKGAWHYSVAQAYGATSRYAFLRQNPGASAYFTTTLKKAGLYEIYEIVPKTVNAANRALYVITHDEVTRDSIYIDQNSNSGAWVLLGRYHLPENAFVEIKIVDTGTSTTGDVLRADAIKFVLTEESTAVGELAIGKLPRDFRLMQNYPNPFNPTTIIEYEIPQTIPVRLEIFDIMGNRVRTLVGAVQNAGRYKITWDARNHDNVKVAAGLYLCRMSAGNFVESKKMILLQ